MPHKHLALTPEALVMIDAIARNGSFAGAARELGRVPSALTYSVRQLEEALDVLLFDRGSGQARMTPAGRELLDEGRRLLVEISGVANRVRRVATGWETELTLSVDDALSAQTLLDLVEAFYAHKPKSGGSPPTRLRLRTEVLAGTWEALMSGQADLAIGVPIDSITAPPGFEVQTLGELRFVLAVSPSHPLAKVKGPISDEQLLKHRAIAVADSASRMPALTVNLLPGQDVLTVSSLQAKLQAQIRNVGCGFLPEPLVRKAVEDRLLVIKEVKRPMAPARFGYAWRQARGGHEAQENPSLGLALSWWLQQLRSAATRKALIEAH